MKTLYCDNDAKNGKKDVDVNRISVVSEDNDIAVYIKSDGDIGGVYLNLSKARELAAEIIRLADEIEKQ